MKLYLDCFPCVLNQTLAACRALQIPDPLQKEIFTEALEILRTADPEVPPPELVAKVHTVIRDLTGIDDLYFEQKRKSTEKALALYAPMKALVQRSGDPFDTAVRLSIAGNIIDFGINDSNKVDLSAEIDRVLEKPYAINNTSALRQEINDAKTILYLADNAGETVFDRIFIETIGKKVLYVVKGRPILNDAIEEDAVAAGIDNVAKIISSGTDTPGTVLSHCSESFRSQFSDADLIISKGQGNFESLSSRKENIFFLLQTKCETLVKELGVPAGSLVVKRTQE